MNKELQDIEEGAVDGVIIRLQNAETEKLLKELLGEALRPWIKIAFVAGRIEAQTEQLDELTLKAKTIKVLEKNND